MTSRRQFLKGAVGLTGAGVLGTRTRATPANIGPISIPSALAIDGLCDIKHVVVVMMENRSFDHFMGWLPGADGIGLHPDGSVADEERFASFTFPDAKGTSHPIYHETAWNACGLKDQDHGYTGGRIQWNGGAMNGFLLDPANTEFSLSYYLAAQRAFTSPLAMAYTTCDNYRCGYLGPTWPNRLFQFSAQTDRQNDTLSPDDASSPVEYSSMPTIWDQLNQPGGPTGRYYFSDLPFLALWGPKYLPISTQWPEFLVDAAAGELPNVSFVDPRFIGEGNGITNDDHPLTDIRAGDAFLSEIFHAVANSPNWPNTMMIINYDEWGGFFDHVPPVWVAPGNQTLDRSDVVRDAKGTITKVLSGFRVPCIIASPYSRSQTDLPRVSHSLFDHTSILRFIEWNWKLDPLTPRDASIPLLGPSNERLSNIIHALRFDKPDYSVPELPELSPFYSTGCDVPGDPGGGPVVGGEPIADADGRQSWVELRQSDLVKGWI